MSTKTIETKLKLVVEVDEWNESPRKWGNLGTMVCFHRRYDLGDRYNYDDLREAYQDICEEVNPYRASILQNAYDEDFIDEDQAISSLRKVIEKDIIMLPLYLYDHSGLTMNTTGFSCPWDSGRVGFIYVTREECKKEGWDIDNHEDRKKIIRYLNSEVEVYDQYLRGDVYYARIVEYDEEYNNEYDVIDSCGDFYGSDIEENGMMDFLKENDCEYLLTKGTDVYNYMKNY